MDEREFLDLIYIGWKKTTKAENSYWMHEEMVNNPEKFKVYAVTVNPETQEQTRDLVASFLSEEDAAFVTALHGSLPDIVRRCHEAFDEADRLDEEKDRLEGVVFELELESDAMSRELDKLLEDI